MITKKLKTAIKQYWGYDEFRPLQEQAMEAICRGRDAVVVLPTGGGKSLCYQVPAVVLTGLTVVVSPLISLMKDQVDDLIECGIAAARIDSSLSPQRRQEVETAVLEKKLRLLYVAPERLMTEGFVDLLQKADLSLVAIDEAHCISMWGHDFRPEYRQLGSLRSLFPKVVIGAYTATATEQVRKDIVEQLHLKEPAVLVGSFDRPNLVYKVRARNRSGTPGSRRPRPSSRRIRHHLLHPPRRRRGCGRADGQGLSCGALSRRHDRRGSQAEPGRLHPGEGRYHRGHHCLRHGDRQVQRPLRDPRRHAQVPGALPAGERPRRPRRPGGGLLPVLRGRRLRHVEEPAGRHGARGLRRRPGQAQPDVPLLHGRTLPPRNDSVLFRPVPGQDASAEPATSAWVTSTRSPTAWSWPRRSSPASSAWASGSAAGYIALVLTGSREARVLENGHDNLSTYGLLSDHDRSVVLDWIEQLTGQGHLDKTGDFNVLAVTATGWQVVRGQVTPRLLSPAVKTQRKAVSAVKGDSWEGVDRSLFEALRGVRSGLAQKKGVPAYVIFGDAALRDMARRRPATRHEFLEVKGVGHVKSEQYAELMLEAIRSHGTAQPS